MTTTSATSGLLANSQYNLSNLSKGVGEFINGNRKVEVVLDDQDKFKKRFQTFIGKPKRDSKLPSISKREINLPKTYSTKKGALLLFSEDFVTEKKIQNSHSEQDLIDYDDLPIKTVSEFQKNVLFYGISQEETKEIITNVDNEDEIYTERSTFINTNEKFNVNDSKIDDDSSSDYQMLSLLNMTQKKLSETEPEVELQAQDVRLKRINRGYSARRYLSNWTKHWDQKLLNNLIKDGKINEETIFEQNIINKQKKKRLNDDLSTIPPAYRIHRHWLFTPGNLKGYRFFKIQDYYLTKTFKDDFIPNNISLAISKTEPKLDNKNSKISIESDPIKIRDTQGIELSYANLDEDEKENVLSELLFQSALQNIAIQQIDILEDSIKKNESSLPDPLNTAESSLDKLKANTKQKFEEIEKMVIDEDETNDVDLESNELLDSKLDLKQQSYMFGKMSGARWVQKRDQKSFKDSNEKFENEILTKSTDHIENTKVLPKPNIALINSQLLEDAEKLRGSIKSQPRPVKSNKSSKLDKEKTVLTRSEKSIIIELNKNQQIFKPEIKKPSQYVPPNSSRTAVPIKTFETENLVSKFNENDEYYERPSVLSKIIIEPKTNRSLQVENLPQESTQTPKKNDLKFDNELNKKFYTNSPLPPIGDITDKSSVKLKRNTSLINYNTKKQRDLPSGTLLIAPDDEPMKIGKTLNSRKQLSEKSITNIINENNKKDKKSSVMENNNIKDEEPNSTIIKRTLDFENGDMKINDIYNSWNYESKSAVNSPDKKSRSKPLDEQKNQTGFIDQIKDIENINNIKTINEAEIKDDNLTSDSFINITAPAQSIVSGQQKNNIENKYKNSNKESEKVSQFGALIPHVQIKKEFSSTSLKDKIVGEKLMSSIEYIDEEKRTRIIAKSVTPGMREKKIDAIDVTKEEDTTLINNTFYKQTTFTVQLPNEDIQQEIESKTDEDLIKPELLFLDRRQPSFIYREKLKEKIEEQTNLTKEKHDLVMTEEKLVSWKTWKGGIKEQPVPENYHLRGYTGEYDTDDVKGHIKLKAPNERLSKRTVNWSKGDFDPREFFMLWSYESPQAPIVDKEFADALRKYAQFIARAVLRKGGGISLSEDVKRALRENFERLKQAIADGKIGPEALEEYKKILKQALARALKRKDLENVEIDDDTLMALLELPPDAFEIYKDPITGKEILRIKSSYRRKMEETVRTVVTHKDININDFDVEIDPITGKVKYKLKADVAKKLGIPEGAEDMFEVITDSDGNQVIRLKNGAKTIKIGNTTYELYTDPITGKQTLKMVTKQDVGKETLEDILRLAANMSPETRHKYFQDLLKQSGGEMSEELRKRIINEMLINANNLDPELRDNLLKDLMKNLINELPPDLAQKVLADIMQSTDVLDSALKEQMIKNMLESLDDLPPELKEKALKELIKNLDNLSSEAKNQLLQDILSKVEEMGGDPELSKQLRNEVLKEIIKNSQNLDEETRAKILQDVISKLQSEGGSVPANILQELVKQMGSLPDSIKITILEEIKKGMENGDISASVLEELLKNADNIPIDLLESVVKMADKMQPSVMKELMKNIDKLPDELKQKVLNDMINNLDNLDTTVRQEFLKNLLSNPSLITDPELREKVIKEIMQSLTIDDILKETANMTAEERNRYFQDLLKRAGDMSEETRAQLINALLKNAENLDEETRNNLLKDLMQNVIKDLPPDIAAKVLGEIMKNTDNLDSSIKQQMLKNLLDNLDDLPPELKQQALQEVIKNLDSLTAEQKQELLQDILNKVDMLPPELAEKTLKALMENLDNLSAEQKAQLLQDILSKVDNLPPELQEKALKNLMENLDSLSAEQKAQLLQDILTKIDDLPPELQEKALKNLMQNLDNLSSEQKNQLLQDILNKVEEMGGDNELAKQLRNEVMKEIIKNSQDLDDETRAKILGDIMTKLQEEGGEIPTTILQELSKQMGSLPDSIKAAVMDEIKKNIAKGTLDAEVLENLLNNAKDIPQDVLKELAKNAKNLAPNALIKLVNNLDKLPDDLKKQVMQDMINDIKNLDPSVQQELLKELLNKPGILDDPKLREKAIRDIMDNMKNLPDNVKANMLKDIAKNIDKLPPAMKEQIVKDIISNMQSASEQDRKDILKQLLKQMDRDALEEMIKNMDLPDDVKAKMLNELRNMPDDESLWGSEDERALEGLSSADKAKKKRQIMEERKKQQNLEKLEKNNGFEGNGANSVNNWKNSLRDGDREKTGRKHRQKLKDIKVEKDKDGNIIITDEQKKFLENFENLTEEEKQKFLETLTAEERAEFLKMQEEYKQQEREKEMQEKMDEAKRLAEIRIKQRLDLARRVQFGNALQLELYGLNYSKQLTRAFVFSYFDLIGWLGIDERPIVEMMRS